MPMTREEFSILQLPETERSIEEAAGRDPLEAALDPRIPHARLVATQLKYRERARRKLPSFAAAGAILPPRAFEQASSEACALSKQLAGESVLDLTCGLGVDAWALSRRFRRVTALERDPLLAEITAWNLRKLGVEHVEVVCAPAEEFLQQEGLRYDWIYADPDRRSAAGRKMVCLTDCSPDIGALLPRLREVAPRICIKNSPLFDVDEAFRVFGAGCRVEVLSAGDECKEVVVYADGSPASLTATAVGRGSATYTREEAAAAPALPESFDPARYGWLVLPDVALRKARMARRHLAGRADLWSESGFGFAAEPFDDPLVRLLPIETIEPYDPQRLKRALKGARAEVLKRDFPLAQEELMRRLGLRAGSDLRLAFTKIGNDYWAIRLKTLPL